MGAATASRERGEHGVSDAVKKRIGQSIIRASADERIAAWKSQ